MNHLKKLITASLLLLLPLINKAQTISTFAGNGYNAGFGPGGYTGDGGPAIDAELSLPVDVTFDKSGNLYIADRDNNVVRMVDNAGIITTFAGNGIAGFSGDGGPATSAELANIIGVLFDSIGNLYISQDGYERIRKVNTTGIIATIAGNGVLGFSGDGGPATAAELFSPCFLVMDEKGNLLFADGYNNVIRKIDTSGIITTIAGNHVQGYSGDGGPATAAELNIPEGVAFDKDGSLIIGDADNYVVRKVDTSGIISTIAGNHHIGFSGDGGLATAAELNQPDGIITDASGTIYFADEENNVIRTIDGSGIIHTIAGNGKQGYSGDGGPAIVAEMDAVSNIAFDTFGNMFLSDEGNNVIREVKGISTAVYQFSSSTPNNFQFSIFPNPTNQTLNLTFNRLPTGLATLSIMDITGREVYNSRFTIHNSQLSVDVSSLATGMYFINLKTKDTYVTQKFLTE
jgi:hypothetical protein